jgi:hypothetical protein
MSGASIATKSLVRSHALGVGRPRCLSSGCTTQVSIFFVYQELPAPDGGGRKPAVSGNIKTEGVQAFARLKAAATPEATILEEARTESCALTHTFADDFG